MSQEAFCRYFPPGGKQFVFFLLLPAGFFGPNVQCSRPDIFCYWLAAIGEAGANKTTPGPGSVAAPARSERASVGGVRGRTKKHITGPQHWCFAVATPGLFRPGLVDQPFLVIGSSGSPGPEQKNLGSIAAQSRGGSRAVFSFAPAPPSPASP